MENNGYKSLKKELFKNILFIKNVDNKNIEKCTKNLRNKFIMKQSYRYLQRILQTHIRDCYRYY